MSDNIKAFKEIDEYPPILQARHVKELLGIGENKVYEILNSSKCPTISMGKRKVVFKDSFIRYLYSCEGESVF